jgi:hypothetical protein
MLYELAAFNDEKLALSSETIHSHVLSDSDGFPPATSKNIYKASIRWVMANNHYPNKVWPIKWMETSVAELADFLLN